MLKFDAVISFVIFRTHPGEIRAAVDQVLRSPGNNHVVLVDNTVPPLDLGAYAGPRVTIVQAGANLGYGSGHNLALRAFEGRARYHFVLNTDLAFGPDVIAHLTRFMDAHPEVGLTMPRVLYPNGDLQHLCRLLPRPIDVFSRAFLGRTRWAKELTQRYEVHDWGYDQPVSFPFLSGCFMVIRPEVLAKVGLFDERFFLFAEDLDLSRRLHRESQTVLCPEVHVVHDYRTRQQPSLWRKLLQIRSFITYFNKYGWFFDNERTQMNRQTLTRLMSARSGDGQRDFPA